MILRLGCLLVLVPVLELVILIRIGQEIGVWPTIGLVVGTGLLGVLLARREGVRVLRAIQLELSAGRLPTEALLEGAAVLLGGALLVMPGILTDLAGLVLLLPTTRRLFSAWVRSRMAGALERGTLHIGVWGPGPHPSAESDPHRGVSGSEGRKGEIIQE
ncbi:MAG: FxsA family protein [Gemmatimonadetes bacterium]|nr:FxsA family protein [Gemmatimonadota bacterium]